MTIRINDPSDAPGILDLFRRVFIEEEGANSDGDAGDPRFLSWKYADRASGRPLSIAALDEGGRVIGHTGLVFQTMSGPEGPGPAALNVDSAVDPAHRSLSVYLGLMKRAIQEARAAGASLVYTHANGNAAPVMRKALRFRELFSYRGMIRVPPTVLLPRGLGRPDPMVRRAESFPEGYVPVDSSIRLSREEYDRRFFRVPTRRYEAWHSGDYLVIGKEKRPRGVPVLLVLSVFRRQEPTREMPTGADEASGRACALRSLARELRRPVITLIHDPESRAALRKAGFFDATSLMGRFLGGPVDVLGLPLDDRDRSGFRCAIGDIDT